MDKSTWEQHIIEACKKAGTYQEHFSDVIDTLAGILEKRDEAEKQYFQMGGRPVTTHENKAGATNWVKNPALVIYMDLNTQALSYWRDLGLTPSGLKKLNADVIKGTGGSFEKLLERIV